MLIKAIHTDGKQENYQTFKDVADKINDIRVLNAAEYQMNNADLEVLTEVLENNTSLKGLFFRISFTQVSDKNFLELAKVLQNNLTLNVLHIYFDELDIEFTYDLAEILKSNYVFSDLEFITGSRPRLYLEVPYIIPIRNTKIVEKLSNGLLNNTTNQKMLHVFAETYRHVIKGHLLGIGFDAKKVDEIIQDSLQRYKPYKALMSDVAKKMDLFPEEIFNHIAKYVLPTGQRAMLDAEEKANKFRKERQERSSFMCVIQ